jgi:uncharacterized OB-fold protein
LLDLAAGPGVTGSEQSGAAVLIGGHCLACGESWFPSRSVCPRCAATDTDTESLTIGPGGRIYSFTTVHVSAARPTPYVLGYVDTDQGIRVLSTIDDSGASLELDQRCTLRTDAGGEWWFVPQEQG